MQTLQNLYSTNRFQLKLIYIFLCQDEVFLYIATISILTVWFCYVDLFNFAHFVTIIFYIFTYLIYLFIYSGISSYLSLLLLFLTLTLSRRIELELVLYILCIFFLSFTILSTRKKTISIQLNPIQRFKQHTGHINVFQIIFPKANSK